MHHESLNNKGQEKMNVNEKKLMVEMQNFKRTKGQMILNTSIAPRNSSTQSLLN